MENLPRIFDSEIIITEANKWMFRGNEITLDSVLKFFKENLSEDEEGIFITNTYGNLTEKGYVTCMGFPLQFIRWEEENDHFYEMIVLNKSQNGIEKNIIIYLKVEKDFFSFKLKNLTTKHDWKDLQSVLLDLSQKII
jgi:hypothetical protein